MQSIAQQTMAMILLVLLVLRFLLLVVVVIIVLLLLLLLIVLLLLLNGVLLHLLGFFSLFSTNSIFDAINCSTNNGND